MSYSWYVADRSDQVKQTFVVTMATQSVYESRLMVLLSETSNKSVVSYYAYIFELSEYNLSNINAFNNIFQ